MSASLMEALQGFVTPALIKTATSTLGESEGALTSGLGAIVSKILSALVSGAGDSNLMNTVAGLVSAQARDPGALNDVAGLLTGSLPNSTASIAGSQLVGALFGVREGGIAQSVASAAGLRPQSGASLMALAAPMVLGALGKAPGATSMTGAALSSLLNSERGSLLGSLAPAAAAAVAAAAPAAVAAATAAATAAPAKPAPAPAPVQAAAAAAPAKPAAPTPAAAPARPAAAAAAPAPSRESEGAGMSWLLWFIPLLLLAGIGWFLWETQFKELKSQAPEPAPAAQVEKKAEAAPATAPAPAAAPEPAPAPAAVAEPAPAVAVDAGNGMMSIKLPDGQSIKFAKDGVEGKLINFLQDANSVIDKKTWFDFDRLNFETGSTTLTAESKDQVSNVAAIMKAFATSAIKIGGYTDNVGQPESNLKLSDERAKKVMEELVGMGIAADRVEAEGYGEQFPIASNDSEDGRKQNRRTALSVRAR